jgi:hypothetical protein
LKATSPVRPSTTFDELPEEVIVNILSFIPSRVLLTTVSLVNQKLRRLVNDSTLWNHVNFYFNDSPSFISNVLSRFKNCIRSVALVSRATELKEKLWILNFSKISVF